MRRLSRFFAAAATVACTISTAMAIPARPGYTEVVQPDGSVISVRLEGDEFGHLVFDRQNRLLERDERGFYVVSQADEELLRQAISSRRKAHGTARYTKAKERPNIGLFTHTNFPATGSNRTLVILVEFQDRSFRLDDPKDFFDRMLNGEDFTDYGATGSAGKYFADNSQGQFTPYFDVMGPVKVPRNMAYYGANVPVQTSGMFTLFDDAHPAEMVLDACKILKDEGLDFSQYDTNGDGEVDNIYVYYAGFGEADGGPADSIWPHAWYLNFLEGVDPVYYDGVVLGHYACSNELSYPKKLGDPIEPDGIGTIVHEFSHVMGFPDLYATLGYECNTPRYWSVMDVGCYLNKSRTPPNFSAVELMAFGWIAPEELSEGTYTLDNLHSESGMAYYVHRTELNAEGELPDEFFVFENRQKEGWDKFLPSHGMLVWHVDFDQDAWDGNYPNSYPKHQRVRIIEADNKPATHEVVEEPGKMPEYKEVLYNEGDPFPGTTGNTAFTPISTPAFVDWNGNAMPFDIVEISEGEDGRIRFRVTAAGESGVENVVWSDSEPIRYYNLQGQPVAHPRRGDLLLKVQGTRAAKVLY